MKWLILGQIFLNQGPRTWEIVDNCTFSSPWLGFCSLVQVGISIVTHLAWSHPPLLPASPVMLGHIQKPRMHISFKSIPYQIKVFLFFNVWKRHVLTTNATVSIPLQPHVRRPLKSLDGGLGDDDDDDMERASKWVAVWVLCQAVWLNARVFRSQEASRRWDLLRGSVLQHNIRCLPRVSQGREVLIGKQDTPDLSCSWKAVMPAEGIVLKGNRKPPKLDSSPATERGGLNVGNGGDSPLKQIRRVGWDLSRRRYQKRKN